MASNKNKKKNACDKKKEFRFIVKFYIHKSKVKNIIIRNKYLGLMKNLVNYILRQCVYRRDNINAAIRFFKKIINEELNIKNFERTLIEYKYKIADEIRKEIKKYMNEKDIVNILQVNKAEFYKKRIFKKVAKFIDIVNKTNGNAQEKLKVAQKYYDDLYNDIKLNHNSKVIKKLTEWKIEEYNQSKDKNKEKDLDKFFQNIDKRKQFKINFDRVKKKSTKESLKKSLYYGYFLSQAAILYLVDLKEEYYQKLYPDIPRNSNNIFSVVKHKTIKVAIKTFEGFMGLRNKYFEERKNPELKPSQYTIKEYPNLPKYKKIVNKDGTLNDLFTTETFTYKNGFNIKDNKIIIGGKKYYGSFTTVFIPKNQVEYLKKFEYVKFQELSLKKVNDRYQFIIVCIAPKTEIKGLDYNNSLVLDYGYKTIGLINTIDLDPKIMHHGFIFNAITELEKQKRKYQRYKDINELKLDPLVYDKLYGRYNDKIDTYINLYTNKIIKEATKKNIGTIVGSDFNDMKTNLMKIMKKKEMAHKYKQIIALFPLSEIRHKLKYKCDRLGLKYYELKQENYTSATDLLALEKLGKKKTYLGERKGRLFKSSCGFSIHSETNGAGNNCRQYLEENRLIKILKKFEELIANNKKALCRPKAIYLYDKVKYKYSSKELELIRKSNIGDIIRLQNNKEIEVDEKLKKKAKVTLKARNKFKTVPVNIDKIKKKKGCAKYRREKRKEMKKEIA